MTDLDDGLDTSAPVWYPASLYADWLELPPGEEASGNSDTQRLLGPQLGPGGWQVEHSLEDALPDPVTMTTGNDASGKLAATLTGREAAYADTIGWRTNAQGGSGTGTTITATPPTDTTWGDYTVVAITTVAVGLTMVDTNADPDNPHGWQLLGSQADGNLVAWVWGRPYYAAGGPLSVVLSGSADWSWVAGSAYARSANGAIQVPLRPGTMVSAAESVSQTSHPSPSAVLDRRGWLVGIWGSGVQTWTAGGGSTEVNEAGTTTRVMLSHLLRTEPGSGALTATTSATTATAVMLALPLNIVDRERMSPQRYFSPLNTDSPLHGWERDTAPVRGEFNVVTPAGIVGTQIFQGQMAGIGLESGLGKLVAVSEQRVKLNTSRTLPPISGRRQQVGIDTIATMLMAEGGSYAGPGPSENTIYWNPLYGSIQPFMDGPLGYGGKYRWSDTGGPFGVTYPEAVDGPFVGGMHAHTTATDAQAIIHSADLVRTRRVPGKVGAFHDFMSQQNTKGRLSFWIRGDAAEANTWIAANDPGRNWLFRWVINNQLPGINMGGITIYINPTTRLLRVSMGQQSGYSAVNFAGSALPVDGLWHFIGVSWDWTAGEVKVMVDGYGSSAASYATTPSILPVSDAEFMTQPGASFANYTHSFLPISDMQIETGPDCWSGVDAFTDFARFYPVATDINAVYRRTNQPLEAVANSTPLNSWDTLADLARNTLAQYRCDEEDRFNFLDLRYFGEDDQMTSTGVADTDLNAGELNVIQDPTKIRNVVTLNFLETREDSTRQPVLAITSAVSIPRGTSLITFSLDIPSTEIHGAVNPYGSSGFDLTLLTAAHVAAPNTIPNDNCLTANVNQDGGGTYLTPVSFSARIVGWDSSTVTIRFINKTPKPVWLANNGQEVPFLRVLGYGVRASEAYSTQRDEGSVKRRRERPLISEMNWIHHRTVAEEVAGNLLNITTEPRPELRMRVVGDPRRKPGQLVTVNDSAGTQAEGTWRVLSVAHDHDGPQYVQDLHLTKVDPELIWGQDPGWGISVWG
jgi:hypothetical protein